jgi:hypothetical protein
MECPVQRDCDLLYLPLRHRCGQAAEAVRVDDDASVQQGVAQAVRTDSGLRVNVAVVHKQSASQHRNKRLAKRSRHCPRLGTIRCPVDRRMTIIDQSGGVKMDRSVNIITCGQRW